MDEIALAEKLMSHDSSHPEGIKEVAGLVASWLEARDIDLTVHTIDGLPSLVADVGPDDAPTVIFHGHVDVVPAPVEMFTPRFEGDKLIGRGAYDMKGALAGMLLATEDLLDQDDVRIRLVVVPDEESDKATNRASDVLVDDEGIGGDFAITGEPTDLHVGVEAKGVLALGIEVSGRSAHGSTPWIGDNAVLKAYDVYRAIESLPFSHESSALFRRPSINLGRIRGGDALNKVPDRCAIDVDIRYLPDQEPSDILDQIRTIPDTAILSTFCRPPASVDPEHRYVATLCDAVGRLHQGEATSVGRDGASDAVSFLEAGIPAVEFGPIGAGHHGPEEWVSVDSLRQYRHTLTRFVRDLPARLG
ncbi:MAG: M20 family metallopeptidase [Solirubrobacterales bacterium]